MKHGCGTRGAAPASDVAGRSDAQGTLLLARPAASCHVDSMWFSPTRSDAASTRADSPGIRPTQAWIGLNQSKRPIQAEIQKKKGAECTIWLISKPYFSPVSHKRQNISSHLSSHFVSHFTCLCALCLSASVPSPLWLWDTQPLSLLLQFILSSALSHAFLTQVSL